MTIVQGPKEFDFRNLIVVLLFLGGAAFLSWGILFPSKKNPTVTTNIEHVEHVEPAGSEVQESIETAESAESFDVPVDAFKEGAVVIAARLADKTDKALVTPKYKPYMQDLQRRVKRAWFPPKGLEDQGIMVNFKIHREGEMSDLRIGQGCGIDAADRAALQAIENAAPFRPLPVGAPPDVDVQFSFDESVFYSQGRKVQY